MSNARLASKISVEKIEAELAAMSRDPFKRVLAQLLDCAPTPEAMRALAQKNPDRHAQAVAIWGRLAGYNERLEVEASVSASVKGMSDAELEDRITELEGQLKTLLRPSKAQKTTRLVPIPAPSPALRDNDGDNVPEA